MSKPTVGVFVVHSCIRTHKISWTLKNLGYKVILFTANANHAHPWWVYDAAVRVHTDPDNTTPFFQLRNMLDAVDPLIDIYHVHNEPDWPVGTIKKVTKKPVIYDVHDLKSQRQEQEEYEKEAFELCDGVSTVSDRYVKLAQKYTKAPVKEVLSCVPEFMFPKGSTKIQHKGVVYEGGMGSQSTFETKGEFKCRLWADTFKKIMKTGTPVWAYTASSGTDLSDYDNTGTIVLGPFGYKSLLGNLTAHEAGLVGSPEPDSMFDGAMPNKLFEYMAAGLPILAWNAGKCVNNFILATGIGAVLDDLEEIPDVLEVFRKEKFKERVWELRNNWTMEGQIGKVETLYRKALGD